MTWLRWIELIFGAVLPTLLAVPPLLGFVFVVFVSDMDTKALMVMAGLALMCALGVMGIISLWLSILFGPDQINQRPRMHGFVVTTLVLGVLEGICLGGYIVTMCILHIEIYGLLIWLSLVGPVIVAFRYLPQLLKGTT